jgi:hypothetical protein
VHAKLFQFPNPVNELAARVVAGVVLILSAALLVLSLTAGHAWLWLVAVLAYGFVARVLTGPTLSPLGQLATRVVAPRLGPPRLVAGPPKRFAQAVGAAFTVTALVGVMVLASGLESIFALCVGCKVFAVLMRVGLVPEATCEACNNIQLRAASA